MPRSPKNPNLAAARARMYHDLVFECAERVFAEKGVNAASMQDIAAEAGISLKTLYNSFEGKDDLYREIVAQRGAGLVRALEDSLAASGAAFERLAAGLRGIVHYLVAHRSFFEILLREGRAWGLDPRAVDARKAWEEGRGVLGEVLRTGMEAGEILEGDAELLAATVNAVLQVQLANLLERDPDSDPDQLTDRILVPLQRMLCRRIPTERAVA